jgi:hypothetical protein
MVVRTFFKSERSHWPIAPSIQSVRFLKGPSFACAGWSKENLAEDKSLASVGAIADRMEKLFDIGIAKVDACFGHLRSLVQICTCVLSLGCDFVFAGLVDAVRFDMLHVSFVT